jgi:hypothetical protein
VHKTLEIRSKASSTISPLESSISLSLKGGDFAILSAIEAAILFFPLLRFFIFPTQRKLVKEPEIGKRVGCAPVLPLDPVGTGPPS